MTDKPQQDLPCCCISMSDVTVTLIVETMRDEDAAQRMAKLSSLDPATGHSDADDLLCEILLSLGYTRTVEAFRKLRKRYE